MCLYGGMNVAANVYLPLPKTKEEWLEQAELLYARSDSLEATSRLNTANLRKHYAFKDAAATARELGMAYAHIAAAYPETPKQKATP